MTCGTVALWLTKGIDQWQSQLTIAVHTFTSGMQTRGRMKSVSALERKRSQALP